METLTKVYDHTFLERMREDLIAYLKDTCDVSLFNQYSLTKINHQSRDPGELLLTIEGGDKTGQEELRSRLEKVTSGILGWCEYVDIVEQGNNIRRHKLYLAHAYDYFKHMPRPEPTPEQQEEPVLEKAPAPPKVTHTYRKPESPPSRPATAVRIMPSVKRHFEITSRQVIEIAARGVGIA